MKRINRNIQEPWLHRRGFRGKWITIYFHRYKGSESTERFHSHPWALAIGIVLRGSLYETIENSDNQPRRRGLLSIGIYTKRTRHRIEKGHADTIFFGLLRTQTKIVQAAPYRTRQGYCHHTELMPGEPGYIPI